MKEKLIRFMQGRYGLDGLSRCMLVVGLILLFVALIFREPELLSHMLYLLGLVVVVLAYVRVFSRNIQKRYAENVKYSAFTGKIKRFFGKEKYMMQQRKDYKLFDCPGCGQKIRIPKGKGKIEISCPKCHTKFVKNPI